MEKLFYLELVEKQYLKELVGWMILRKDIIRQKAVKSKTGQKTVVASKQDKDVMKEFNKTKKKTIKRFSGRYKKISTRKSST
jgi:hypothetical protein